jgi:purine-nucleoside phosphorylase
MYNFEEYQKAAGLITQRLGGFVPETGLVLGSGLGDLAERIEHPVVIPYGEIPGFMVSTAPSHKGQLVAGSLSGKPVIAMQGRMHYYEGYGFDAIAFPGRVLKLLGVKRLILTNAAGGVNKEFEVGDLMLVTDHIKFFDESPLRGANLKEFGPRFNDMSFTYDETLRRTAKQAADSLGIPLKEGVYFFMPGPQYETPAEIRAIRALGGDAVGMSTAPEAIAAAHCALPVLGISLISNMAAGVLPKPLSEEEVVEAGNQAGEKFGALIERILVAL